MTDLNKNSDIKLEQNVESKSKEDNIEISKNDIKLMTNILEVVSKRGGFVLDEFQIVGDFNKRLRELL